MKNKIIVPLFLVVLELCYLSYHLGNSKGFDRGWDKGYIRGLENDQNVAELEDLRAELTAQGDYVDELQDELADKEAKNGN